jgi:hypothetical protein
LAYGNILFNKGGLEHEEGFSGSFTGGLMRFMLCPAGGDCAVTEETQDKGYIPWHSGFRDAIQATLEPYRDILELTFEHQAD